MTEVGDYFVNRCLESAISNYPYPHQAFSDTLPADSFNKLRKCCENFDIEKLNAEQAIDSDHQPQSRDDFPTLKVFNDINGPWRRRHLPRDDPKEKGGGQFGRHVQQLHLNRDKYMSEGTNLPFSNPKFPKYLYPVQWKEYNIDFWDEIQSIGKAVLKNARELCSGLRAPKYRWYKKLGINAHVKIDPPLPYDYYIHADQAEKVWSCVTYISPEKNIGTRLYTGKTENTLAKTLPWKPNDTIAFCGDTEKSFHSYSNNQMLNRYTLCIFLIKSNTASAHMGLEITT